MGLVRSVQALLAYVQVLLTLLPFFVAHTPCTPNWCLRNISNLLCSTIGSIILLGLLKYLSLPLKLLAFYRCIGVSPIIYSFFLNLLRIFVVSKNLLDVPTSIIPTIAYVFQCKVSVFIVIPCIFWVWPFPSTITMIVTVFTEFTFLDKVWSGRWVISSSKRHSAKKYIYTCTHVPVT